MALFVAVAACLALPTPDSMLLNNDLTIALKSKYMNSY